MTNNGDEKSDRIKLLVSQLVDDGLAEGELAELQRLVDSDDAALESYVDQMLLDSLLAEELSQDSVVSLVDLVAGETSSEAASIPIVEKAKSERFRYGRRYASWLAIAAGIAIVAFSIGRWDSSSYANASAIVRAAIVSHAGPIERVYAVTIERSADDGTELDAPRDVRIHTQGDQFWVEMNRSDRRWAWGRDSEGVVWLTLGQNRSTKIAPNEIGPSLQYICDQYSLQLESLLGSVLRNFEVEYLADNGATHLINAKVIHGRTSQVRNAEIEVDKETKAVRRLVMTREIGQQSVSRVSFTLIESGVPDETKYRPEGHLVEPYRMYTQTKNPDKRMAVLTAWFGPAAERWIVSDESKKTKAPKKK